MSSRRFACIVALSVVACGGVPDGDPEQLGESEQPLIGQNWTSFWQASIKTSLTASEGNLSSGAIDWAHFTGTSIDSNPNSGLRNLKKWGNFTTIPTGALAFSWTTSAGSSKSDVRSHLRTCGGSASIELDVPASTKGRLLRLFVGAHNAKVVANAWIANPGVSINTIQNASGGQFGYYDVEYSAAQDNSVLKVDLQIEQAGNTPIGANSCISLLAAKVTELPSKTGAVAISVHNGITDLFEGWNYPVAVSATHPDGVRGVELFYNNVKVSQDTTPPYEFVMTTKAGPGKLHAEITSNRGTTYKSAQQNVVGWYHYLKFGGEAIPDAGGWVEGALTPLTPVSGKTVKAVVAFTSIQHPYVGDLQLKLVSPNDKEVILAQNLGGAGADYAWTYFDDRTSTAITSASAPFQGWFKPQQPMVSPTAPTGMLGEPSSGAKPWRMSVRDTYAADVGWISYRDIYLKLD